MLPTNIFMGSRLCAPPRLLAFIVLLSLAASAMARPPRPWEGSDRPTPYTVVNTRTGYPTTVLPLGGWTAVGLPVSLVLFHNPDGSGWAYTGMKDSNWTHSFGARLAGTLNGYELMEADGQVKAFTSTNGTTFTEDAGWFDRLTAYYGYSDRYASFMARDVVRRNGTRLVFAETDNTIPEEKDPPEVCSQSGGQTDSQWTNPDYGHSLRLRRIIDRNGNVIRLTYAGAGGTGNLESVTDANGRALTFTHNPNSTVITDPSGQTWTLNWGTYRTLTSVQNAATGMTTRTFAFTYNNPSNYRQRIASLTPWYTGTAPNPVWSYTYEGVTPVVTEVGGPSSWDDGERPFTAYTYGSGWTTMERPIGLDWSQSPISRFTNHYHDTSGDLTEVMTSGADNYTVMQYNAAHQLTRVSQFDGTGETQWVEATYDTAGRKTLVQRGNPTPESEKIICYEDTNNPYLPTHVVDEALGLTMFKYDTHGNLTDVWDANTNDAWDDPATPPTPSTLTQHTHYTVDTKGRVTQVSNYTTGSTMLKTWTYTYASTDPILGNNAYGNLTSVQRPGESSATLAFSYDLLSRPVRARRSSSETATTYSWDNFGRLTGIDYPGGSSPDIHYTWDARDQLSEMADQTGVVTSWDVDLIGRVTAEYKDRGTQDEKSASWDYRDDGKVTSFTNWKSTETLTYAYDTDKGNLASITGPWGNDSVTFSWCESCGGPDAVWYPNMVRMDNSDIGYTGRAYRDGALAVIYSDALYAAHLPNFDTTNGRDSSHSVRMESSGPDGNDRTRLFWDPSIHYDEPSGSVRAERLHRLVYETLDSDVSGEDFALAYGLDAVGNRTGLSGTQTTAYAYDADGRNQLQSVTFGTGNTECYSYSQGNTSQITQSKTGFSGSLTFGYSYANQLTSITPSGSYGSTEVRFVYDGLGRLAQRRNASNQVTASYYYAGNRLTYLVEGNNEVTFQWGAGEPLSQIQGGNAYWYVFDSLGNVVGLLNGSNTLVAKYVYDAWGNEASTSFDNLPVKNPLRYRGAKGYLHLYGPDACRGWSLYLAGARVYHTGVGRWLTEDPLLGNLGDPMSFNRYLYVNGNPVDFSDPSGLATTQHRPCDYRKDNPFGAGYDVLVAYPMIVFTAVGTKKFVIPRIPPAVRAEGVDDLVASARWLAGWFGSKVSGRIYCFFYDHILGWGPDSLPPGTPAPATSYAGGTMPGDYTHSTYAR